MGRSAEARAAAAPYLARMNNFFARFPAPRACLAALLTFAAGGAMAADACQVIHDASVATLDARSGLRQYMGSVKDRPERLVSIIAGDSVYVAMGPNHWSRMSRAEQRAQAMEAEKMKRMTGCHPSGSDVLNGERVSVFEYQVEFGGMRTITAKAWIGPDGLLRKQATEGRGWIRYEYKDVHAPS